MTRDTVSRNICCKNCGNDLDDAQCSDSRADARNRRWGAEIHGVVLGGTNDNAFHVVPARASRNESNRFCVEQQARVYNQRGIDKREGRNHKMPMSVGAAAILAAIGVACAAYGLWFVRSETKMRFHFVWFALAAVLVAPTALVATGLWGSVPAVLRWVPAAALAAFAAYELLIGAAVGRHFNDKAAPGLDYVVVLGAQVLDGKPGRTFTVRLDAALAYLSENPRCRCVVCGGQGPSESIPEAHAGRDYLVERGINRERILLEANSHSTVQNLRAAAELVNLENDAVGIVTHNYHMARSLAVARKAGMKHVSGIAVKSDGRFPLNGIVRETFAWAKDLFRGNA